MDSRHDYNSSETLLCRFTTLLEVNAYKALTKPSYNSTIQEMLDIINSGHYTGGEIKMLDYSPLLQQNDNYSIDPKLNIIKSILYDYLKISYRFETQKYYTFKLYYDIAKILGIQNKYGAFVRIKEILDEYSKPYEPYEPEYNKDQYNIYMKKRIYLGTRTPVEYNVYGQPKPVDEVRPKIIPRIIRKSNEYNRMNHDKVLPYGNLEEDLRFVNLDTDVICRHCHARHHSDQCPVDIRYRNFGEYLGYTDKYGFIDVKLEDYELEFNRKIRAREERESKGIIIVPETETKIIRETENGLDKFKPQRERKPKQRTEE